jgi:hypothetical protein
MTDPTMRNAVAFTRLSVLVASVALLTSRVMLLVHEFVGHAAPATLFGGRVVGWYLFLFAGGRVSYRLGEMSDDRRLVVALGGISIELLVGALALLLARARRDRATVAFCLVFVGTVLVVHPAMYLARGVHYGFGDGALLGRQLGGSRVIVVMAASALGVGATLAGARRLARFAASFFAGTPRRVTSMILLVLVCAGLVHGVLAVTELHFSSDAGYSRAMESASVTSARDEMANRIARAKRLGEAVPSPEEQARMMKALERARRPWPLDPLLVLAVLTALVVGVVRGTREQRATEVETDPVDLPSWRDVHRILAALALVLAVILVVRSFGLSIGP